MQAPTSAFLIQSRAMLTSGVVLLLSGCLSPTSPSSDGVQEPFADPEITVERLEVFPAESALLPGDTIVFRAEFRMKNGDKVETDSVDWTAEEGVIDERGRFTAPNKKGKYRVIGRARGSDGNDPDGTGLADTAEVNVGDSSDGVDLEPASVVVAPGGVQLEPGQTQRFSAEVRNLEGLVLSAAVTWDGSGGLVNEAGDYTAGSDDGDFEVAATAANGATGSVGVTVAAPQVENVEPQANFTHACDELVCQFDGSGSIDSDGSITSHQWTFGDGSQASGPSPTHTYASAGSYSVRLTVSDEDGATATRTRSITVADSTPSNPVPPAYDVAISAGQSIQAAVNANPPGTVFLLRAGVFAGQQVTPKADQVFIGEAGTILDGNGATAFAFGSYGIPGARVSIRNLTIQNYQPQTIQQGAIQGDNAVDWVLQDLIVRNNRGVGIRLGPGMIVSGGRATGNDNLGIGGYQATGATVENVEIDGNGFAGLSGEHSGLKVVRTRDLTLRGNNVHDNVGRGLWLDTGIFNALIEDNLIEDNSQEGIWLEVVCGAVARGNTARRNGIGGPVNPGYPNHAGIEVQNGMDVEIYGNTVEDNHNGISVLGGAGYPDLECGPELRNVYVHDNIVRQSRGAAAGSADNRGDVDYSTIRFEQNTYTLSSGAGFVWQGEQMSYSQWQSAGHQ